MFGAGVVVARMRGVRDWGYSADVEWVWNGFGMGLDCSLYVCTFVLYRTMSVGGTIDVRVRVK